MSDQHQPINGESSPTAAIMLPCDGEDVFVENGELSITTADDDDDAGAADASTGLDLETQTKKKKRTRQKTNRTNRPSACCVALACLAAAGGACAALRICARQGGGGDAGAEAVASQKHVHDTFPVVVRTIFPSASEADDVLQALNLDVMGRGRLLATTGPDSGGSGGSNSGPIERDVMLHSPEDWSSLDGAVTSFTIDEDHTSLLFLDESTTYNPPPNRRNLVSNYETMPYRPCYRTVQGTYDTMYDIAASYPQLATVETIGLSYKGEPILMLKLTGPESTQSPKSNREPMVITSGIHAREYAPVEIATRLVEHLTSRYGLDADVTAMLDHTVLHVVLQANPDSRRVADKNLSSSQPRKNQNDATGCPTETLWGTDLNRNFDFMHGRPGASDSPCHITYRGKTAASEPETKAIQNLSKRVFPASQRKANPEDDPFGAYSDLSRGLYVGESVLIFIFAVLLIVSTGICLCGSPLIFSSHLSCRHQQTFTPMGTISYSLTATRMSGKSGTSMRSSP